MAQVNLASVWQQVRSWFSQSADQQAGDGDLLERFLTGRDEAAFAALVQRHGTLVLGVCQRLLGVTPAAEDAFQAAFLVLAQRAQTICKRPSLGSWLHGVARRVALKARGQELVRKAHEAKAAAMRSNETSASAWSDLQLVLDEELERLPEKYRQPLVLCYLEDHTHEEIAARLGWPVGTVKSRLAKGRALLHGQLTRRGITLSAGALATALAANAAGAPPPPALMHAVTQAALLVGAGQTAAGVASASALALAEGIVPMASSGSMHWFGAALVAATLLVGGAVAYPFLAGLGTDTPEPAPGGGALPNLAMHEPDGQAGKPEDNTKPLALAAEIESVDGKPYVKIYLVNPNKTALEITDKHTPAFNVQSLIDVQIANKEIMLSTRGVFSIQGPAKRMKLAAASQTFLGTLAFVRSEKTTADGYLPIVYQVTRDKEQNRTAELLPPGKYTLKIQAVKPGLVQLPAAVTATTIDIDLSQKPAKGDAKKMIGLWHGVAAVINGRPSAYESSLSFKFSDNYISVTNVKRPETNALRLDSAKKKIDFLDEEGKPVYRGIYEFRGQQLWIIQNSDERGARPKNMDPTPITPADFIRLLVLSRKPRPADEVDGLKAELTGPVMVADDAEDFEVVLKLTNVGKARLRLGMLTGSSGDEPGRSEYEYTFTPDRFKSDRPPDAAIAKRVVVLEPGNSLTLPGRVSKAWFKNRDWLTVGIGYQISDEKFIAKHKTWSGNVQAPPLLVRVVPGRNVLNLHEDSAAFVANAKWLKEVAENEIRTSWFLRGEPGIAMICRANLDKGEVYTAREVHDNATQSTRTRELSHDQTVKLRELMTKLPASNTKVPLTDYLLVTIRDNGKPRTFVYDRLHPPPEIVRLFDLTGAYLDSSPAKE